MLTSWSEQSTPADVVDGVGVDPAALAAATASAYSIRPALGEAEVARPRPTTRQRSSPPSTRTRVVGLVAGIGVGLAAGLDVGPDAAVEQQVDRAPAAAPDQLGGRQPLGLDPQGASRTCGGDRDRLWRCGRTRRRPREISAGS